jgi:hypothetical protein
VKRAVPSPAFFSIRLERVPIASQKSDFNDALSLFPESLSVR